MDQTEEDIGQDKTAGPNEFNVSSGHIIPFSTSCLIKWEISRPRIKIVTDISVILLV